MCITLIHIENYCTQFFQIQKIYFLNITLMYRGCVLESGIGTNNSWSKTISSKLMNNDKRFSTLSIWRRLHCRGVVSVVHQPDQLGRPSKQFPRASAILFIVSLNWFQNSIGQVIFLLPEC